jgi:hypothetical protein
MNLNDALEIASANGWKAQHIGERHAVITYDDGGMFARSMDRKRGGSGLARASITEKPDGTVKTKLLSKFTTNALHWARYGALKKAVSQ